jgi:hypothetical protein
MPEPLAIFVVESLVSQVGPIVLEDLVETHRVFGVPDDRIVQQATQEAIAHVASGGDVLVSKGRVTERKAVAERIARRAGSGSPVPFSSAGTMLHEETKSAGPGTLPHRHPVDAAGNKLPGHVFIDHEGRAQSPSNR